MSKVLSKTIKRKLREVVYLVMELNEVANWKLIIEINERKINIWDFNNDRCKYYIENDMGAIFFENIDGQMENELNKVLEKLKKDLINQRIENKEEFKCQK